jgi:hypothetical protein
VDKLSIQVDSNTISDDAVGIWTAGPVTVTGSNTFNRVPTPISSN